MRVGAVAWKVEPCGSPREHAEHASRILEMTDGCEFVVWPEHAVLETLGGQPSLPGEEAALRLASEFDEVRVRLAESVRGSGQTVVAGTHFVPTERGIVNAPLLVRPDGTTAVLPGKNVLTQYELEDWKLAADIGAGLVESAHAGVLNCYDSEFPASARALADAGALLLAVPYFTEDAHGYHRVRWSAHARAVENQVYVLAAGLVGSLDREPVPSTCGSAAVLAPSVEPFPADGVILETARGEEGAAVLDLDFAALVEARQSGDVRNFADREKGAWSAICRV